MEDWSKADLSRADELDWVKLRSDMDEVGLPVESTLDKMKRKFGESPMIPIGCMATVGALVYGVRSFFIGERLMSQYMMRTRVAAQAFTIIAVLISLSSKVPKNN